LKIEEQKEIIDGKLRIYTWERTKRLSGRIGLEMETAGMLSPLSLKGKRYKRHRNKDLRCGVKNLRASCLRISVTSVK
jgi:hypothetical protein